jgi:hypothetical protein
MSASEKFPYSIGLDQSLIRPATVWCQNQYGPRYHIIDYRSGTWSCLWNGFKGNHDYNFYFRHQGDAVMFSLKWGGR